MVAPVTGSWHLVEQCGDAVVVVPPDVVDRSSWRWATQVTTAVLKLSVVILRVFGEVVVPMLVTTLCAGFTMQGVGTFTEGGEEAPAVEAHHARLTVQRELVPETEQ